MIQNFLEFAERYLLHDSSMVIIKTNISGVILEYNQGFERVIGEGEYRGNYLMKYFIINTIETKNAHQSVELFHMRNDKVKTMLKGVVKTVDDVSLYLVERETFMDVNLFEQMSDINLELSNLTREINKKNRALKDKNDQITALMLQDPLTKLNNRRFLYNQFSLLVDKYNEGIIDDIQLAIIDLDKFKYINDHYGHDMGDKVLILFADMIKKRTRDDDLRIRFGGDEFIIVFSNMTLDAANRRLESLTEDMYNKTIDDTDIEMRASIGLVSYREGETFHDFVKRGDNALYLAKENGRNQIVVGDKNVR